uniref:Retrovirus-related Pol polyprotein from transposon RE1 n=1 Tax=Vitis vinifera TaxID=29760 RepID=A5BSF2_VITVI|nr:hypothetical protein VITISV_010697 [Vitis vinifera]
MEESSLESMAKQWKAQKHEETEALKSFAICKSGMQGLIPPREEFCPAEVPPSPNILHPEFYPAKVPPSPDILHPKFCPADIPLSPDISHLAPNARWERRTFQLPRSDMSGSSDSAYPENFSLSIQCRGVLLRLPDIQTNSEDFSSDDERLGSSSLGVKKAGEFEMSMMGELNFFIELQIKQLKEGTFINQAKYIRDLLKRFNMEEAKTMKNPMSSSIKLNKDEKGKSVNSTMYRGIIGSLLYLTASRPDIMYSGDNFELIGFSDADFVGCKVERKSTSGTCHFLGHSLVSWHSMKQNSVALSTAEAEYIAAGLCCAQIIWMKQTLSDFNLFFEHVPIKCDNTSAINISKNLMAPKRETATSKAQDKRSAKPSQPEHMEARQKARIAEQPLAQAHGQGQMHPGVEEEAEIRKMNDGLDSQRDFEQREPELDIPPPPQLEVGPSSQPSFIELPHTKILSQAPHALNHAPWMNLSTQISSFGIRMEELASVHDTRFYSMEEGIDQYQIGFISQFEPF